MHSSEYFSSLSNASSVLTHEANAEVVRWGCPKHKKNLSFENIPFRQDSLLTWETNRALKSGSTIGLTDFACCPLRLVIVTPCSSKVFRHLRRETSEMPTWYCKIAREQQAVFPTSAATSTMMRVQLGKKLSPFAIAACIKNDYTNADNSSISLLHTHTHVTHPDYLQTLWNWMTKYKIFRVFVQCTCSRL